MARTRRCIISIYTRRHSPMGSILSYGSPQMTQEESTASGRDISLFQTAAHRMWPIHTNARQVVAGCRNRKVVCCLFTPSFYFVENPPKRGPTCSGLRMRAEKTLQQIIACRYLAAQLTKVVCRRVSRTGPHREPALFEFGEPRDIHELQAAKLRARKSLCETAAV